MSTRKITAIFTFTFLVFVDVFGMSNYSLQFMIFIHQENPVARK